MDKSARAMEGDIVTVVFDCATDTWCKGRVQYIPAATGDSWVIVADDGTIYHAQTFAFIRVESRKADITNGQQPRKEAR